MAKMKFIALEWAQKSSERVTQIHHIRPIENVFIIYLCGIYFVVSFRLFFIINVGDATIRLRFNDISRALRSKIAYARHRNIYNCRKINCGFCALCSIQFVLILYSVHTFFSSFFAFLSRLRLSSLCCLGCAQIDFTLVEYTRSTHREHISNGCDDTINLNVFLNVSYAIEFSNLVCAIGFWLRRCFDIFTWNICEQVRKQKYPPKKTSLEAHLSPSSIGKSNIINVENKFMANHGKHGVKKTTSRMVLTVVARFRIAKAIEIRFSYAQCELSFGKWFVGVMHTSTARATCNWVNLAWKSLPL